MGDSRSNDRSRMAGREQQGMPGRERARPTASLVRTVLGLALVAGAAMPQALARAQEPAPLPEEAAATATVELPMIGASAAQLPQDIRIMQRIVRTALGEVEPPELPDALEPEAGSSGSSRGRVMNFGDSETTIWALTGSGTRWSIGGRDVTGFYMQGYGYLFTVNWRVGARGLPGMAAERAAELEMLAARARRNAASAEQAEARAAGEAERALEQERQALEERQAARETWSADYRGRLATALREVVAVYGSTLKRAAPEESITFIADFGGDEDETVTVTARAGELAGVNRQENLAAVQMARGESGVSDTLRTELRIMAEIIDGSLQVGDGDNVWVHSSGNARYFGGDSSYQRVPGYGVLFRKGARLNLATNVIRQASPSRRGTVAVAPLRQTIESSTEEQRQAYAEHLTELEQRTAEILATYGPTLTGLGDREWVGVYYDVGSAAGLLEGGITNFLVQARMQDIREAAGQADGAGWLLERLVTNERQD